MALEIVGEWVGNNDGGKNQSGLVLKIKSPRGSLEEFDAIGYVREHTSNPDTSYRERVEQVLADATYAVDTINELLAKYQTGQPT